MWRDPDTWQNLQHIWSLPFGRIAGDCLVVAQIAGGLGVLYARTARAASVVLCAVYLCFALACIPDIVAAQNVYQKYGGTFFVFFSFFLGAFALYAASEVDSGRALFFRRFARIGFGVCEISFTLGQLLLLRETAQLVPKWIPPGQMFWAVITTIAFAAAALATLVNQQARLAIRMVALMLGLFGVLVWVPRVVSQPRAHFLWSECVLTFVTAGAAWMVGDLKAF